MDPFDKPIYRGWTYNLDMVTTESGLYNIIWIIQGDNIVKYIYDNDGLHVYEKDQDRPRRRVNPVGIELKKWESDFYKPRGRKKGISKESW